MLKIRLNWEAEVREIFQVCYLTAMHQTVSSDLKLSCPQQVVLVFLSVTGNS